MDTRVKTTVSLKPEAVEDVRDLARICNTTASELVSELVLRYAQERAEDLATYRKVLADIYAKQ